MLVRELMTPNPITVAPEVTVPDALRVMRQKKVRRLPVVDPGGKLVGYISDKDLLNATPSPATTLSMWEIPELLAKLKVAQFMSREVITVTEDTPLEDAARVMADRHVGGLPVLKDGSLVGIITETDVFKAFLQLMGGRRSGVRITVSVPEAKGTLAKVTNAIFGAGGDIIGLGLREVGDSQAPHWEITFKVQDASRDKLVDAIRPVVREIRDVRET
jgi:acetoin utilization protein AcuB